MNHLFVLLFYFISTGFTASIDKVKTYKGYKEFHISGTKSGIDELEEIVKKYDDTVLYNRRTGTSLQAVVAPEMLSFLDKAVKKRNLQAKLIFDDVAEVIEREKAPTGRGRKFSWNSYYDIDEIYGYLRNMSATYPQWAELVVGGESYEGRQIEGLRINTPDGRNEGKPAMFIESGIHAREWITPATTTYFINQLLTSADPDIVALRNQFDWHIFPSVNPDGYHYSYTKNRMWRKTRSKSPNGCYGADPNRNWDYNWLKTHVNIPILGFNQVLQQQSGNPGKLWRIPNITDEEGASDDPCNSQIYAGSMAFSEKETSSLSRYIANIENLQGYIAYHADAQMLLLPYSDSEQHMDNYDDLVKIGKQSLEYGYRVNGAKYDGPATAAEVLYKVSGGSMDWVRFALGTPLVYTYELRGYYFHWPGPLIYQQGDEVTQMMLGLVHASRDLGYFK